MEEEETNGSKSNGGGGQCAVATFVFSWVLLILNTALSLACTWAYSQQYDKSGTGLSVAAAILTLWSYLWGLWLWHRWKRGKDGNRIPMAVLS